MSRRTKTKKKNKAFDDYRHLANIKYNLTPEK